MSESATGRHPESATEPVAGSTSRPPADTAPREARGPIRPSSGVIGPSSARVMAMLSEHVPLSLLVDLTAPGGPDSRRLLDEEGLPDDAWWDQPASGYDQPASGYDQPASG